MSVRQHRTNKYRPQQELDNHYPSCCNNQDHGDNDRDHHRDHHRDHDRGHTGNHNEGHTGNHCRDNDNDVDPRINNHNEENEIYNHSDCDIPIVPLEYLPRAENLKQGSIILVGDQLEVGNVTEPDLSKYIFVVSNGSHFIGFSPDMIVNV